MRYKHLRLTKRLIVFSHWSRKSYAVFNSLSKAIKIGSLVTPLSLLVQVAEVNAQEDSSKVAMTLSLEEADITAESAAFVYAGQSRIVTLIQQDEFQKWPVSNLAEILEYAAGIDLRSRGPEVQSDLSFRGSSFEQNLILLDGINISDPQSGHYSLNIPLNLLSIERIEILHGSAARIFGANAFASAINIVTKDPEKLSLEIQGKAGEHQTIHGSVGFSFKSKSLGHFLLADVKKSAGYLENTDYSSINSLYKLYYPVGKSKIRLLAALQHKSFGAGFFYSPKYPTQFDNNQGQFINLSVDRRGQVHHSFDLYARTHKDHFTLFRDNPEWYQNFHQSLASGIKYKGSFESLFGISSFGTEFRREQIRSSNLGLPIDSIPVPGEDSAWYRFADARNIVSLYIDQAIVYQAFNLSLGALYQYLPNQNKHGFYPGLDASYRFKNQRYFISISRSLRLPSFTELYYTAPDLIGNPELLPEEALSAELGVKVKEKSFQYNLAGFLRDGTNLIDWVWHDDDQKWHTMNISQFIFYGLESSWRWKNPHLKESGVSGKHQSLSYISQIQVDYTWMNSLSSTQAYQTRYINDYLKHTLSIKADHPIFKGLGISWQAGYQMRTGSYQLYHATDNSYTSEPYKPVCKADIRLWYQQKSYQVYLDFQNISDKSYVDIGNIPQPGRWMFVGFTWKII